MQKIFSGWIVALLFSSCSAHWMGDGAKLGELVDKTQSSIDGGGKGREYIGASSRQERSEIEGKLARAQALKGTKAGDFYWASFEVLTGVKDLPKWTTRISVEATVLTASGLAAWDQSEANAKPKEKDDKEDKAEKKKDKADKKDKKKDGAVYEGVTSKLKLTRPVKGEPWRIEDIAIDIEGAAYEALAAKKPFADGAALTKEEANNAAFDVSLFAVSPPFDSAFMVSSFGGALATGDTRAFFLVAAPQEKPLEDLAARLNDLSETSREVQVILSDAPSFVSLPANIAELKVVLRGEDGERLSYTIKRTKDGYRLSSLKARSKKDGVEIDLKPLATDPAWAPLNKSTK